MKVNLFDNRKLKISEHVLQPGDLPFTIYHLQFATLSGLEVSRASGAPPWGANV